MPLRQWVLSLPIPLRVLLPTQPTEALSEFIGVAVAARLQAVSRCFHRIS